MSTAFATDLPAGQLERRLGLAPAGAAEEAPTDAAVGRGTPAQVAADVVITLLYHGVITNKRATLDRIARLTGVTDQDLAAARDRRSRVSYQPFTVHTRCDTGPTDVPADPPPAPRPGPGRRAPTRDTAPRPAGARKATRSRAERMVDGIRELWCTGHDGHAPHFAPEIEFAVRADRPHLRYTYCDDGRRSYTRARLVTVKVKEDLGRIGIRLVVEPGSTLVGILCAGCEKPIVEHDQVEGGATVYHVACLPDAER